ncbi:MAG TPA: RDD family protein [Actinobacteria bacterium]|nr:RDD family protein [Actinomycetota bacterium]
MSQPLPDLPGEVAGLGRRLIALLIDWFACMGVAILLAGAAGYASDLTSLVTLLIFTIEVVLFTWLIGGSFGQRIMGIRITRLDGSRLGLWRIVARTLLICLVIPPLVVDSQGRGLQDRAVGSVALLGR